MFMTNEVDAGYVWLDVSSLDSWLVHRATKTKQRRENISNIVITTQIHTIFHVTHA